MMKNVSIVTRSFAILGVLAAAFTMTPAWAQSTPASPHSTVLRVSYQGETHTGLCCSTWDGKVTINEPEKLVPIVVTFSTDYRSTAPFYAALRINGGPCVFYGPASLSPFSPEDGTFNSKTFQWVIMPGDYALMRGPNLLQLCGGAELSAHDALTLGFYTLSARLQR